MSDQKKGGKEKREPQARVPVAGVSMISIAGGVYGLLCHNASQRTAETKRRSGRWEDSMEVKIREESFEAGEYGEKIWSRPSAIEKGQTGGEK